MTDIVSPIPMIQPHIKVVSPSDNTPRNIYVFGKKIDLTCSSSKEHSLSTFPSPYQLSINAHLGGGSRCALQGDSIT